MNPIIYSNVIENAEWKGYGFKLENISRINPIYINGKLSLWEYNQKDE